MAVLVETSGPRARGRVSLERFVAWHPEWWVWAVALTAAAVLAVPPMAQAISDVVTGHDHASHSHAPARGPVSSWSAWAEGWGRWALMVAAMMLPVVAPQVRTVASRSLWSRRHRAAVAFVLGYAAVWLLGGAMLVALLISVGRPEASGALLVVALLGAAAWHVAPRRRLALRRCTALRLASPSGRAADLECSRAGLRTGLRCLQTCGPMMLTMALTHSLLLMTGLALVMLAERSRGPDPLRRAGRPREAWALVGYAFVAGLWTAWQW